jgi:protease-4
MKFFSRLFAVIGFSVVLSLLTGALIGYFSQSAPKLPQQFVLVLDFADQTGGNSSKAPFSSLLTSDGLTAFDISSALDRAAADPRVLGFAADVSASALDMAATEEVRAALIRFAAKGKFTTAWADSFGELGPATRDYWLASGFQQINLQPLGMVGLVGPSLSLPFAREALDKLGVEPNVFRRHEFKSAMDTFNDKALSDPVRQNYTQLITDIFEQMSKDIAISRKLDPAKLKALVDLAPLDDETAKEAGLIDELIYRAAWVKKLSDTHENAKQINLADYINSRPYHAPKGDKTRSLGTVALIMVHGPIVRGSTDESGFASDTAGARSVARYIEQAARQEDVAYILLRIDSPGGSVAASETIHNAVLEAKANGKKVVVSMAGTAASGGYWIASAADHIVANASTITGSIGVVAGKFSFGALSEKLGVHWDSIGTGANSTMWDGSKPFTPEQAARIERSMDRTYEAFTKRVMEGRKITPEKIDILARGRVWSGQTAHALGLVDEIGGMYEAITYIKHDLGGDESSKIALRPIPEPVSNIDQLVKTLEKLSKTKSPLGVNVSPLDVLAHAIMLRAQSLLGLAPHGMAQLPVNIEVR